MSLTHITDHQKRAVARALDQLKGKPKWEAFLKAFIAEVQEIEDMWWSILDSLDLDQATGTQLDLIGKIVKRKRQGLGHDDYRLVLKAHIRANRSSGTADDVLDVLALVVGRDADIDWRNYPRASFVADIREPTTFSAAILAQLVARSRLGGVNGRVFYSPREVSARFGFASGSTPTSGTGRGWGVGRFIGSRQA